MIFCTHLVDSLLPLERLLGSRRFTEFLTDKPAKKSRIPCPNFGESRFPGSSQIPNPVKIFCVFPNPTPYFGQIPDPENTHPDPVRKEREFGRNVARLNTPGNHHGKVKMVLLPLDYKQSPIPSGKSQAKEHAIKREDHLSCGNVTHLMSASVVSQRETACSLTSPSFFPSHP